MLLPLWDSVIVLCFVVRFLSSLLVYNHLDGEERAGFLLSLSCWCLVIVVWLSLGVQLDSLQFVIVVFPDHTHLPFLSFTLLYFNCSQSYI